MGSVEKNVEVIKRAMAAANDDTMATIAPQIIAPGFIRHDLTNALPGVVGPGGVTVFVRTLRSAMLDMRITAEDIFGAGDRVAMRIRVTGTHNGEILGIAPTGRRVELWGNSGRTSSIVTMYSSLRKLGHNDSSVPRYASQSTGVGQGWRPSSTRQDSRISLPISCSSGPRAGCQPGSTWPRGEAGLSACIV
jgi:hypothetical protein